MKLNCFYKFYPPFTLYQANKKTGTELFQIKGNIAVDGEI